MVKVMVIHSALVRSHQSTSAGSFGLVRPAWIRYTRSAVPQDVEGGSPDLPARRDARFAYTVHARRAPGGSRCCIIKPNCGVGGYMLNTSEDVT